MTRPFPGERNHLVEREWLLIHSPTPDGRQIVTPSATAPNPSRLQPLAAGVESGQPTAYHPDDYQRGCSSLEKLQRLTDRRFAARAASKNRVNSVELPTGQYRAKPVDSLEGVTTRAQARSAKRHETPGPGRRFIIPLGGEIVCSAGELAAV